MGWRDRAEPAQAQATGGGWRSRAEPVESPGAGGAGEGGARLAAPGNEGTFKLPYPEQPVEGLEYDPQTRKPMGSLTGPANPFRAATLGLAAGATLGGSARMASKVDAALGTDTEEGSLHKYRNAQELNKEVYPTLSSASRMAGTVLSPVMRIGGGIGAGVKGLSGVGLRVLAAMGLGGAMGGAEGALEAEGGLTDPATIERAKRGALYGAAAGGAGQAVIGEPLRFLGGVVGSRIAKSDQAIGEAADAEIASARGRAGKQAQEAVGAVENLDNARGIRGRLPEAPPAPRGPMGLPPNARMGDPLYHVQGLEPAAAEQMLVDKFRMVPEEAADFVKNEAAPYLKQSAAAPGPAGPATKVMRKYGPQVMNDLLDRRVGNADEKIGDLLNNPVQIPGRGTAMRNAVNAAEGAARAEMTGGAKQMAVGAIAGKIPVIGPVVGGYNVGKGIQRIVRGVTSSPALLNRLRGIPGAGQAIARAAGKGSVALETTLFSYSRDPAVAAELEKIDGEMAPLRPAPASSEEE